MKFESLLDGIECDLNGTTLDAACVKLGCRTCDGTLWCSDGWRTGAHKLQAYHGFKLVEVPGSMLKSRAMWAVEFAGRLVGSLGVE